ncbi:MAG: hypothetical protein H7Z37_15260 [Pyrinomonadaceae bacterium]|nr:hypothetical protein [Pyrinomonadaceae bacterium]
MAARFAKNETRDFERLIIPNYMEKLTGNSPLITDSLCERILCVEESYSIWFNLLLNWNIERQRYWYPLESCERSDVEAFQDSYFETEVGAEKLRTILRNYGVQTVWEMRENDRNCELELLAFEPDYNGAEGYFCDENFDWIIYASHENSITIGGWLLTEIQRDWVNWKERVWTTPLLD